MCSCFSLMSYDLRDHSRNVPCRGDLIKIISPRHYNMLTFQKKFTNILTEENVTDSHSEMDPVGVRFNYWKPIKTQTVKGKNNNIGNFKPEN